MLRPLAWLPLLGACAHPVPPARLDAAAPPLDRELAAEARLHPMAGTPAALVPGAYMLASGQTAEGVATASLATAELGAGLGLLATHPRRDLTEDEGLLVPWVALQDAAVYAWSDSLLDFQRAHRMPYTPLDTTRELVAAPFNPQVLRRPAVWGGLIGLLGAGFAVDTLVAGRAPTLSTRPVNLYGARLSPAVGHPLATASSGLLFEHVALAEEAAFRGVLQSGLVRSTGSETGGWALGSAGFGALHAANALLLPEDERKDYLLYAVPSITLIGGYLGLAYRWSDYSLAPPVALHFWYDLLVVGLEVATSPGDNFYSVGTSGRF